jgi:hypothetical protein
MTWATDSNSRPPEPRSLSAAARRIMSFVRLPEWDRAG